MGGRGVAQGPQPGLEGARRGREARGRKRQIAVVVGLRRGVHGEHGPCHIRATHDSHPRSMTVTRSPSARVMSSTWPRHQGGARHRHRSSKLVMRVRFPSPRPIFRFEEPACTPAWRHDVASSSNDGHSPAATLRRSRCHSSAVGTSSSGSCRRRAPLTFPGAQGRWPGCRHDLDQLPATVRAGRQVTVGGPRGRLVPERLELAEAVAA